MYKIIPNDKVLSEFVSGAELYVADITTLRLMSCSELTLQAIKSFINKADTVFILHE